MKLRFAPEGWIFIIPFAILAALALLMHSSIAAIVFSAVAALLIVFPPDRGSRVRMVIAWR